MPSHIALLAIASCATAYHLGVNGFDLDKRKLIGTAGDEAIADFPGELFHSFLSRPDIKAPRFNLQVHDKQALAPGYWFVAPYHNLDQADNAKAWVGPYIYDNEGEVVWCGAALFDHFNVFDFQAVEFDGEQMLKLKYPHGDAGVIIDSSYRVRQQVDFNKDGKYGRDMHEFRVVDGGAHALFTISTEQKSTVGQAQEVGLENNQTCKSLWKGFQKVDSLTSEPIFIWDARDHLSLTEVTYKPNTYERLCTRPGGFWDILHINAVDQFPDGDYLVSSRHTDTLYKVNHTDGSVVWRLGGKSSDWQWNDPDVKFSRQHHATVHGQNETHFVVGMFDNAIGTGPDEHATHDNSRGLLLALDRRTGFASVAAQYDHPEGGMVNSRGSFQTLPNGNAFMGWTYHTLLSEHAADGRLLMKAQLKLPGHCYRNYKYPWVGHPTAPPDVYAAADTAVNGSMRTVAHVSWNGATEVAYWRLLRSDATGEVAETVASTPRAGFETALVFDGFASYVVAEAVDRDGNALGRSLPFKTAAPDNVSDGAVVDDLDWLQDHTVVPGGASRAVQAVVGSPIVAFTAGFIVAILSVLALWLVRRDRDAPGICSWLNFRREKSTDAQPLLDASQSEGSADVEYGNAERKGEDA